MIIRIVECFQAAALMMIITIELELIHLSHRSASIILRTAASLVGSNLLSSVGGEKT
jgi:hypothetical protein